MASLYELNNELYELLENGFNMACIDEETGEINPEAAAAFLDDLMLERGEKIENIALYIKSLECDAEAIAAEEKRLKKRKEQKQRKAERLRDYLRSSLLAFGDKKFETARVALSFRSSRQVVVADMSKLPTEYVREKVTMEADKIAIKKAIDEGQEIAGAYVEEKKNLTIL